MPGTLEEAVHSTDSEAWQEAIDAELDAHRKCHTWIIVKRKPHMKTIDSKWVFKITNPEAAKAHYKARLCARGFMQREGIDYTDTFAPVVRYDSVRVLLAIINQRGMEMVTFDDKSAFLNGYLEEKIYMEVPKGVSVGDKVNKRKLCLFKKALYGLKQGPRCWNKRFKKFLEKFKIVACDGDQCIFVGFVNGELVLLAIFVDDGFMACKSVEVLNFILSELNKEFEITVGDATYFVGLQIKRDKINNTMIIHQSAYIEQVICKYGMSEANSLSIPADPNVILHAAECDNDLPNVL